MKAILLVVALAAVPACGKQNDVATLKEEAVTLVKYYNPKVDALDTRVQAIFKRGSTIPGNLPGIEEVGKRLAEARDTIVKLRDKIGPGSGGKSDVETKAEAAAKDGKVGDLKKLVDETEAEIDRGLTIINADVESVEAWIANYDNKTLALNAPATGAQPSGEPGAPAPGGAEPAAPEAAPAGQQPTAPQPQQGSAAPAQPNAQAGSAAAQPKK
jgi:hypothetical protein